MNKTDLQLLVATKNAGKIKELEELLNGLPVNLRSLRDFPDVPDVEETGQTFLENAVLKAQSYARQTDMWALSDDSGLEVAALGNAPGVFSARYAGEKASDAGNIEKLLLELERSQSEDRSARFVCAMTIADEKGEIIFSAEEICAGRIAFEPRGKGGFGYDPIFVPEGFESTFSELSNNIKQQISHRARASAKIIRYLRDFIAV